jgi:hypothetical protein
VGVLFVNISARAAPVLTFGTYTVRNVNTTLRTARVLTKCTAAGLPSLPAQRS